MTTPVFYARPAITGSTLTVPPALASWDTAGTPGLPDRVPVLALNDLDNYLFPLVPKLTEGTGRQFASVWATKRPAATSSVAVCQAHTVQDPGGECSLPVQTTASASTTAYKQQIRDQDAPDPGRPLCRLTSEARLERAAASAREADDDLPRCHVRTTAGTA